MRRLLPFLLAAGLLCTLSTRAYSYSLFTHELLIDLTWKNSIRPLLQQRYPALKNAQLEDAHAYAYGGCTIQDLGYYPLSDQFFSNLTHYVRSGDFILALLRDARDADEYAFALGAMSHYFGDNVGHHDAVNPATAISFPSLGHTYGPSVTYDENPHAHVRTEFAFDVGQLGKRRLAPAAYLRFIGLHVPQRLLEQAFEETYSLPLHRVVGNRRPIIGPYRFAVRSFLPRLAYAESLLHRNSFPLDTPNPATETFLKELNNADFEPTWNQYRKSASFRTRLIAFLIRIIPKIGIFSDLSIKIPTEQTEELYIASVDRAVAAYRASLKEVNVRSPSAQLLPNRDLDTGEKTKPGAYPLTDKTYAQLLRKITADPAHAIEPGLKEDVLAFYSDPDAPISTKKHPKEWAQVLKDLATLRQLPDGNGTTTAAQ